jgi:peptidoglycan hydrolase-like protein with peptidoglycan-binding domain
MRKIHSFSSFNRLYEATGSPEQAVPKETEQKFAPGLIGDSLAKGTTPTAKSKLYDQTLGMALSNIVSSYLSLVPFPTTPYESKIDADLASVKSTPVADKVKAFSAIMDKVKKASASNTVKGAQEALDAWIAAGTKSAEALGAIITQYKDQPEELKHINDVVNTYLDGFAKELEGASKENSLKKDLATLTKESYSGDFDDEFVFEGKKGMIGDVSKQITLVLAKLAALESTPGMAEEVAKLKNEVNQIAAQMGELLDKKRKDINREDIEKASARLEEIPTLLDKTAENMLKQDTTNKEAAALLVQALELIKAAKDKAVAYFQAKAEADKAAEVSATVTYSADKANEENPTVKKFQELVISKLGKSKQISSLAAYKKMGSDGKYGPGTKTMVSIVKAGFDLKDTSGDTITSEVIKELEKQEALKESRIYSFSHYVGLSLNEAFDTAKATAAAKASAPKATGSGGAGVAVKRGVVNPAKKRLLFKKGDSGTYVTAINRIVGQTSDEKNYTDETVKKVKDFQDLNKLFVDGVCGEDTLTALYNTRGDFKGEPKPKLNDENAPRGPWSYARLAELLGQVYNLPKQEESKVSKDIGDIFQQLVKASLGAGTDEGAFLKAIRRIKTPDDVKVLNAMFDQAQRNQNNAALRATGVLAVVTAAFPAAAPFTGAAALGLFISNSLSGWNNTSLQAVINDEFGSDDIGTVKLMADHLNKIGVKASFQETPGGNYKEDTFTIIV